MASGRACPYLDSWPQCGVQMCMALHEICHRRFLVGGRLQLRWRKWFDLCRLCHVGGHGVRDTGATEQQLATCCRSTAAASSGSRPLDSRLFDEGCVYGRRLGRLTGLAHGWRPGRGQGASDGLAELSMHSCTNMQDPSWWWAARIADRCARQDNSRGDPRHRRLTVDPETCSFAFFLEAGRECHPAFDKWLD